MSNEPTKSFKPSKLAACRARSEKEFRIAIVNDEDDVLGVFDFMHSSWTREAAFDQVFNRRFPKGGPLPSGQRCVYINDSTGEY